MTYRGIYTCDRCEKEFSDEGAKNGKMICLNDLWRREGSKEKNIHLCNECGKSLKYWLKVRKTKSKGQER